MKDWNSCLRMFRSRPRAGIVLSINRWQFWQQSHTKAMSCTQHWLQYSTGGCVPRNIWTTFHRNPRPRALCQYSCILKHYFDFSIASEIWPNGTVRTFNLFLSLKQLNIAKKRHVFVLIPMPDESLWHQLAINKTACNENASHKFIFREKHVEFPSHFSKVMNNKCTSNGRPLARIIGVVIKPGIIEVSCFNKFRLSFQPQRATPQLK